MIVNRVAVKVEKISFVKTVKDMLVNDWLKQFTNESQETNWSTLWWNGTLTWIVKDLEFFSM